MAASDPSTYTSTFIGRMVAAGTAGSRGGGGLLPDQPVVREALAPRASRLRGGRWRRLRRRGTLLRARRPCRSLCPRLGECRAPVRLVVFGGDEPLRAGTRRVACGDGTVVGGSRQTLVGLTRLSRRLPGARLRRRLPAGRFCRFGPCRRPRRLRPGRRP